jgi:hypothetical protein
MNPFAIALLERCRELAAERLTASVARGLDTLPASFYALLEQAYWPAEIQILTQARSRVEPHRRDIEQDFTRHFIALFDLNVAGGAVQRNVPRELALGDLKLIDDASINLQLALGKLGRKTMDEIDPEQLIGIESRIGELVTGRLLVGEGNPLSVETAMSALNLSCQVVSDDDAVRMVFVNGLQPYVAAGLREVFREVNELLIAEGVQPRIRYEVTRNPREQSSQETSPQGLAPPRPGQTGPPPQGGYAVQRGYPAQGPGQAWPPSQGGSARQDGYAAQEPAQGGPPAQGAFEPHQGGYSAQGQGAGAPLGQGGYSPQGRHPAQEQRPQGGRTFSQEGYPQQGQLPQEGGSAQSGSSPPWMQQQVAFAHGLLPHGMSVSQAMNLQELMSPQSGANVDIGAIAAMMLAAAPQRGLQGGARLLSNPNGVLFNPAMATPASASLVAELAVRQSGIAAQADLVAALRSMAARSDQPLDQLTGELVANMFVYIQGDQAVPQTVKTEMARLPVATFKAAVLDRSFFAKREHPLREFLEEVAQLAADPETDTRPGSQFVQELHDIVDWIVSQFGSDLEVFDTAREKLRESAEEAAAAQRRVLAERAAEFERAERLEAARAEAAVDVVARIDESVPEFVRTFLMEIWAELLVEAQIHSLAGPDSREVRLGVVEALSWSVAPKQAADVPHLASMLGKLVTDLQHGMQAAKLSKEARQQFLGDLMSKHTELVQEARSGKPPPARSPIDLTQTLQLPLPPRPLAIEAVKGLERGAVVELADETPPVRAKLAWISPRRSIYLFTSGNGHERHFRPDALIEGLQRGTVRLIDERHTLIDRALASLTVS